MKLIQSNPEIQIKRSGFSSELVITGCRFETVCACGKTLSHESEEILVDNILGGDHWVCITFSCGACPREEWEEEAQLEIAITAKLKTCI